MNTPLYDLNKIKFITDKTTFEKAIDLYEKGKVTNFKKNFNGCSAVVLGGSHYNVDVSFKDPSKGNCDCYMGQNNYLCKHMVAVAIYAVLNGSSMTSEEKEINDVPVFSGKLGELNELELAEVKKSITNALKYIKGYVGPSKMWFAYQGSLQEGCSRLSSIVSKLPASKQTANLIVKLLLRVDKKLSEGGVDDSDGTVGGFIEETVMVLEEYAKADKTCIEIFKLLCSVSTCFDWQEPLVLIWDESDL
ncbi:MAG: SWIM zinc finger family protein [Minisyncoccales bacterium]